MSARGGDTTWQVNIERVVVTGVAPGVVDAGALRGLVERRIAELAAGMALPPGRAMRASVSVEARALRGADAIANAVADGVSRAVGGGRRA
jgi:hypothetical protein